MANPPASPQTFTFTAGQQTFPLMGVLTKFNGTAKRRHASQVFPKRDGGKEEDMGRDQYRLEVQLHFIGNTAAKDYQKFKAAVHANPSGLLIHPIAGQWYAFCEGPSEDVDFGQALNRIEVRCSWVESQLDAAVTSDVPDVATAAQNASGQQSKFQQSVAAMLGALAKAQTAEATALNKLDSALSTISTLTAPVDFMRSQLDQALGAASSIVGTVSGIATASDLLTQDVSNFIGATTDLFSAATDTSAALAFGSIATLLGTVQADGQALEDLLIAGSATPAGSADAVADVELMIEACLTVNDAIQASQPPTVSYTVASLCNLVELATKIILQWGLNRDPVEYASVILGLNHIPNPAAIPAGTVLLVPAQ